MSDQPATPPKPKPGSLRDRIAAFEKSATTAPASAAAPAPRPKPAGFATWKPKAPSPPASPGATATAPTEHAGTSSLGAKAGGMSASDAKESITKAGSLKDRMAALQGKGAFGAPPPLAPKPATEKPKWKPPPVVHAPVDDDDHAADASTPAAIAAAVERTLSPPTSVRSHEETEASHDGEAPEGVAVHDAAAAGDENEGEAAAVDPEEEERQRRAAIAARMARLGGARVGMAPPVFGKKPPVRRPTQEEAPAPKAVEDVSRSDSVSSLDAPKSIIESPQVSSPPIDETPAQSLPAEAHEDVAKSPEAGLSRKASASAAVPPADDSHSSKSPASMPVPAVPRRAGPPRKKPVKPVASPPEVPEEPAPITNEPEAGNLKEASVEKSELPVPSLGQATESSEVEELKEELKDLISSPPTQPISSLPPLDDSTPRNELVAEVVPKRKDSEAKSISAQDIPASLSGTISEEDEGFQPPPPSVVAIEQDEKEYFESSTEKPIHEHAHISETLASTPLADPSAIHDVDVLLEEAKSDAPNVEEQEEVEDEEARKKRVAERIAKMGGINPFAPPPPPQRTLSSGSAHSPPTVVPSPTTVPVIAHQEDKKDVSDVAIPKPVQALEAETKPEAKVDEELLDEVEEEDEDDASDYDSAVPGESIKHTEGFAKEATSHYDEPEPVHVSHVSQAPPVPLASTRQPMQVQQFTEVHPNEEDRAVSEEETMPARRDSAAAEHSSSLHVHPPRRVIPQAPEDEEVADEVEEEDEEAGERLAQSQLFVPPPSGHRAAAAVITAAKRQEDGDGNESDDTPALPHPQRRLIEDPPARSPPARSPSPPSDYELEPDSDHDGKALPIPPRNAGGHAPPPRSVPPPPPPQDDQEEELSSEDEPVPIRQTIKHHIDITSGPTSPPLLTPTYSVAGSEEILDEEEGDPIDPGFHSPSRRTSFANTHTVAQSPPMHHGSRALPPIQSPVNMLPPSPPAPPAAAVLSGVEEREETDQDAEQLKRRTIAERMAKLGGIKFGSAPPVPVARPPPPLPQETDEVAVGEVEEESTPDALSEEEEERARKARISAKMAQMGGMRIGMMPMGMGSLPPQPSHVLRSDSDIKSSAFAAKPPVPKSPPLHASAPLTRAIPPSRPPPPPAHLPPQTPAGDSDSNYGSAEDGVKVEAEESELEEVAYEHVQEEEQEEAPPPVPSRTSRRMSQHQDEHAAPVPAHPRPPVPTAVPNRRSSVQTTRSTGTGENSNNVPQRKSSVVAPASHSEYVMVEEPEEAPPPPARPASKAPPARRTSQAPQIPQAPALTRQGTDPNDSISSQWELPSIPLSTIDFGAEADLSLSWSDAGNEPVPTSPAPPPPPKKTSVPSDLHLSSDDLIALWGRVGVQVCEVATTMFEKSKKSLVGDGSYAGFVQTVLAAVPNAASVPTPSGEWGYLVYAQNGPSVQKRASEIMPGDIVEIEDAKLKGHKGLQTYHQNVGGAGEILLGVVGEFEAKKTKIRVFHANQHVGQQTVESVSYRLEDLKSGTVKVYRVLEA